jgi:hypothetical protein
MKISHLLVESINPKVTLMDILEKFLPFIVEEYQLPSLPKITLEQKIHDATQPTFGRYADGDHTIDLAILNRHPLDILRTLAHELVHYKQDIEGRINPDSGETGSNIENEANELAGIAMRHFNKQHPEFFSILPVLQSK